MRSREKLHPDVRARLEKLEILAEENGLNFIVTQTLRTEDEQIAYYAQGRESLDRINELREIAGMGPIGEREARLVVTRAKTVWDSYHAYGLAFDIAVLNNKGQIDWGEDADWNGDNISDWEQLGALGESIGLEWGGNFSSLRDMPHFQYRMGKTIGQLRREYGV
jgi:peptidoglycan L-alanyl-D-glutamate endopeptidase CwlK